MNAEDIKRTHIKFGMYLIRCIVLSENMGRVAPSPEEAYDAFVGGITEEKLVASLPEFSLPTLTHEEKDNNGQKNA